MTLKLISDTILEP